MSYVWLDWLADELRAEGCRVDEVDGWEWRGRPSSSGQFDPYGVCWHHTGTTSSESNPHPTLNMCINGRSDLPGPLCQALIGYDGTVHVIAAGRANHAGQCNGFGPFTTGDANAQLVGWEIDYDGDQHMSDAQVDAATLASAAVLRRFGETENYACRHEETSTTGKWDTGHVSGDQLRAWIRDALAGGAPAPEPPKHREIDMFYGTDSTGQGYLCNGIRVNKIKSPAYRDTILAAGVPNIGAQVADFWSMFDNDDGVVDAIRRIETNVAKTD